MYYEYNNTMTYVQRKFYLPEEMYSRLQLLAKASRKTITQVLRETVEVGLKRIQKTHPKKGGAWVLLKLAERAERENWGKNAPHDLSINHDKYFAEAYTKLKENKIK